MLSFWQKLLIKSELRQRLIVTTVLLLVTRILVHIPLSAVTQTSLQNFFSNPQNQAFGLLNIFSGGSLAQFSIVLMSVGPYITATIIIQLLGTVIPSLDALSKEGDYGQQKVNQYMRYLTAPLAVIQAYAMFLLLKNQGIIASWTTPQLVSMLATATAGTMLMLWIGEIISENGIGNGVSLIITFGILASIPTTVIQKYTLIFTGGSIDFQQLYSTLAFVLAAIILIVIIVAMNDAIRKIPVIYARRSTGLTTQDSQSTYLPIKVTTAGVIPIIFAISVLMVPQLLGRFLENVKTHWLAVSATWLANTFSSQTNALVYGISYFILTIFFTYFYTAIILNPTQIAENLQKQSGFIPGIRPGQETAKYIGSVVSRITFIGSIFLGLVAILPVIVPLWTGDQSLVLGGTGILIVVAVIIETMMQIDAQLVMSSYDKY